LRLTLLSLILALGFACADPFTAVQEADTIEAYEAYMADHPDGRFQMQAESRLEELYLQAARDGKTLEAYDAYLERFPEGVLLEKAMLERETFLFDWANATNTIASWEKFLEEYPKANKKRKQHARRVLKVLGYSDHLDVGGVRQKKVNLAENPDGPLDGWGFQVDVSNNGDKTIESLWMTIEYLGDGDVVLDKRDWPLVAPYWTTPVEEERKVPMKPGETRTWDWSTGSLPAKWSEKVRVIPTQLFFVGEADKKK